MPNRFRPQVAWWIGDAGIEERREPHDSRRPRWQMTQASLETRRSYGFVSPAGFFASGWAIFATISAYLNGL